MSSNPEKTKSVDQKTASRFHRIRAHVLARARLLAAQGAVVAAWRSWRGRRLGPYFRLAYREHGRQRSIYLGRSEELARRVRRLLADLREPIRRLCRKLQSQVRASLRQARERLRHELAAWGIHLKGNEFRGVRRALPLKVSRQVFAKPRKTPSLPSRSLGTGRDPPRQSV